MGFGGFLRKAAGFALPLVGTALGGPLGGAAGALVGGALNRKGQQQPASAAAPNPQQAQIDAERKTFQDQATSQTNRGAALNDQYQKGMTSFDPQTYATQAAAGEAKQFGEMAGQMETARRLDTNRRGFIGSPIGTGAQTRDLNSRIATTLATQAQTAGGQRLQQLGSIGAAGEHAADTGLQASSDIYATDRATQEQARQDEQAKKNAKLGFIGQLGGAALGAAGTYLANRTKSAA